MFPNTGNNILKTFCQFNLQLQNPNKLYCLFTRIPLCKAIACARIFSKVTKQNLVSRKHLLDFFPQLSQPRSQGLSSYPLLLLLQQPRSQGPGNEVAAPREGKIRDPRVEVAALLARFVFFFQQFLLCRKFFYWKLPNATPSWSKK